MFTRAALIDLHTRTHRSLSKLLEHCEGFDAADVARTLDGFGYGTILLQLDHLIGAEAYWVGVLNGLDLSDELGQELGTIAELRAFRESVVETTTTYLNGADEAELNTPRAMELWGGNTAELVPAHVLIRTQTHVFQHQGQIAAMARLLGRPVPPGLDFPLR